MIIIDQTDHQDHPSRRQPLLLESRPWEEGDLAEIHHSHRLLLLANSDSVSFFFAEDY